MIREEPKEIQELIQKELKEYLFNEGLEEAMSRIEELLKEKNIIVAMVNGSGINVGKTKFSGDLAKLLKRNDVATLCTGGDINSLDEGKAMLFKESWGNNKKGVIILTKEMQTLPKDVVDSYRKALDGMLRDQMGELDIPADKIDLFISIYSSDRPFQKKNKSDVILGDMIIRNDRATDPSTKY